MLQKTYLLHMCSEMLWTASHYANLIRIITDVSTFRYLSQAIVCLFKFEALRRLFHANAARNIKYHQTPTSLRSIIFLFVRFIYVRL